MNTSVKGVENNPPSTSNPATEVKPTKIKGDKGKTFYTKCGYVFKKQSTASTTGYEVNEDDAQCTKCPFKENIERMKKGKPVKVIECRAGEKKPNKNNNYRTHSINDSTHLSIYSLNYNWLENIKSEVLKMEGVECSYYNQDIEDCRKSLNVGFKKNKSGIKAKNYIINKYFNV